MKLSKRLEAVANMISPGGVIADIGTDHGYVPIYLIEKGMFEKAYAADINKGPIERAEEHIRECGLSDKITTVLSNGMEKLGGKNINKVIIAGMGGELICKILDNSPIISELDEMVLSPHSDIYKVRKKILEKNFRIADEKMIKDAGKYYIIINTVKCKDRDEYDEFELMYGRKLFENKDKIFFEYLTGKLDKYNSILDGLGNTESANVKKEELAIKIRNCQKAINKLKGNEI
ncbi:MAG: SAM-dependent methyltransferase [Lachnospiraceae bacterium]|nr:SAM-dependent methyltransferase [Lachnospiraceae bacterium]